MRYKDVVVVTAAAAADIEAPLTPVIYSCKMSKIDHLSMLLKHL